MSLFELKGLRFGYSRGEEVLKGVDLSLRRGAKTVVIGPNGSGKTTLLLHLNGVLKPTRGAVYFKGRQISYDRRSLRELRSAVGFLFQDPDVQVFAGTVFEDVSFGPMNLGLPGPEVERRVQRALSSLGIEELADRPLHFLSFGQKKLVALAGVLAMEPEVLVLDEPTANLDPAHVEVLLEKVEELRSAGCEVIMSTHDVDLAYSWADEVVIFCEGRAMASGDPEAVFSSEELLRAGSLRRPILLECWTALRERGLADGPPPRDVLSFRRRLGL